MVEDIKFQKQREAAAQARQAREEMEAAEAAALEKARAAAVIQRVYRRAWPQKTGDGVPLAGLPQRGPRVFVCRDAL